MIWPLLEFRELLSEPLRNGIYKPKQFHGRGLKVVNMGELFGHDYIGPQDMKRVELSPRELRTATLEEGDLLFARRSLVLEGSGKCSLVKSLTEPTTFESSIIRARLDINRASPEFYYYFFRSPQGRAQMASIATRTAVSGITGSALANLRIPNPPTEVQQGVVAALSPFEELIENNTRRIAILEEMARSLYREWFVHFRFPGHEKVRMVDSPLGPIPEGWERIELQELADEVRRGISPGEVPPATPYVGLEHIPRRSITLVEWGRADAVSSGKLSFQSGEILFGKIRPYFHKVAVAPFDGICSSDTIVIRPRQAVNRALVLGCVASDEFVAHATQTSSGTKMPRANWSVLRRYRLVRPNPALMQRCAQLIDPILDLLPNLASRNSTLRTTRDLLLPRLISGEINVSRLAEHPEETIA